MGTIKEQVQLHFREEFQEKHPEGWTTLTHADTNRIKFKTLVFQKKLVCQKNSYFSNSSCLHQRKIFWWLWKMMDENLFCCLTDAPYSHGWMSRPATIIGLLLGTMGAINTIWQVIPRAGFPMKLIYRDLVNLGNVVWANTTKSFLNIMSTKKRCAIIKEKETCKVTQRRGLIAL